MKKKERFLVMIICLLAMSFLFISCETDPESGSSSGSIVGTWVYEESGPYVLYDKHTLKFESSGKLVISYSGITSGASEYTWEVNDSILTLTHDAVSWTYTAEYSIKGKELTISNSSNVTVLYPATYTKQ